MKRADERLALEALIGPSSLSSFRLWQIMKENIWGNKGWEKEMWQRIAVRCHMTQHSQNTTNEVLFQPE